jgi:hypothetical protein
MTEVTCALRSSPESESPDKGDHIVDSITLPACVLDEFTNPGEQGAVLWSTHNTNTTTTSEVEQSVIAQFVHSSDCSVLVDSQYRCDVDRGRQTFTLQYLSLGYSSSDLRGDL